MKIPNIFLPERNQDKKLEEILKEKKPEKTRPIKKGMKSLARLPKKIENYNQKGEFLRIPKERWDYFFGEQIPNHIFQAACMTYMAPHSIVFTSIYFLEFESKEELNRLSCSMNLEEEISQTDATRTRCLKKDNYLIAVKSNYTDTKSLDVIGDLYIKNFKLEEL